MTTSKEHFLQRSVCCTSVSSFVVECILLWGIMSMRRSDSKAGSALWSLCQKDTSSFDWSTATGNRKFPTSAFSEPLCLHQSLAPKTFKCIIEQLQNIFIKSEVAVQAWRARRLGSQASCTSKFSWNLKLCVYFCQSWSPCNQQGIGLKVLKGPLWNRSVPAYIHPQPGYERCGHKFRIRQWVRWLWIFSILI